MNALQQVIARHVSHLLILLENVHVHSCSLCQLYRLFCCRRIIGLWEECCTYADTKNPALLMDKLLTNRHATLNFKANDIKHIQIGQCTQTLSHIILVAIF